MQEIVLQFSERVVLANAMNELHGQQSRLKQALAENASLDVVADFEGLREVDTSALAVVLELDRTVRARTSKPLRIRRAPESLRSLARLSSLSSALNWE